MGRFSAELLLAFRFLTSLPLPFGGTMDPGRLGASAAWFPLVGLFLGIVMAAGASLAGMIFPPSVVAALLLILVAAMTGGLHLDGLMDTADGLMGAREPARILAIMRDSRVGAMGVLAAILVLLLKWTLLTSLLAADLGPGRLAPTEMLCLIPTLGRWSMVYALSFYPYARTNGLGRPFTEGAKPARLLIASIITLLIVGPLGGSAGLISGLGVLIFAALITWRMAQRIGGLTGDTYGAVNEGSEVVALLFLVGLSG